MTGRNFELHNGIGGAALAIRITPRASKNEVTEIMNDGTIRIRLTASASEEISNRALIEFLSTILEITPDRIDIVAGKSGKDKLISILGMDAGSVHQKILAQL